MVMLGAVFLAGWVVGSRIRFLHCFYIPSSIIAGFLVLLLGPQVLGRLTDTSGIFPSTVTEVWRSLIRRPYMAHSASRRTHGDVPR